MLLKIKLTIGSLFSFSILFAQMPDDGFTMSKGELCLVAGFKQVKWDEYWEGTRLRENKNLGTFTSNQYMPMAGYGITNRFNLFAGLPYINNRSSAGTMMGMKGWQDLSVAVKYEALELRRPSMNYSVFATIGASLPSTRYVPDFLPFSIGIRSKTASGRIVTHVEHKNHFFFTAQTGYTFRDNIKVDRSTYYTDDQYYTYEMAIPNLWDAGLKFGFANERFRAYALYNVMRSTSGTDMRRNDMPYPGNRMNMTSAGVYGLLWIPGMQGLALNASAEQTLSGRNMGKAFMWMGSIQYVFKPFTKNKKK